MHVALLADTAYLDEELSSFRHLVVGLIDEQVRAAQVVPGSLAVDEPSVFGARLVYPQSKVAFINQRRIARLANPLRELGVDLVHALDGRLWQAGARLAERLEMPAVFTAASCEDLPRIDKLLRTMDPQRLGLIATTQPLAQAVSEKLGEQAVFALVPPGVHPGEQAAARQVDQPLSAVVTGNGKLDRHYQVLLEAMAVIVRDHPQTQFFFDGQGADQHQLWRAAESLNLLSNLSLIPRRLGHREILLRADALLQPQPLGRSRSLTLQAMAAGLPIIAHEDPWLDYFLDDQTATTLDDPTAADWTEHITALILHPDRGEKLGRRSQGWVSEHRRAAAQIAGHLKMYRQVTGESIPFPGKKQGP